MDSLEAELHGLLAPSRKPGSARPADGAGARLEEPVRVGPFLLEEHLGDGGMGTVYGGAHVETDVGVAAKVIRRRADADARGRFHEEVQAHAGLLHPGIVYLFEYGTIDSEAAERVGGNFAAGNPYVAMEFADGGTVRDLVPLQSWDAVRAIVVQILDALAHAHARGVVHRDLKPENLLVFGDQERSERRVKLADFGIAHAFGDEGSRDTDVLSSPIGTPSYMAPEQFGGEWRRYGPWTDLYALGCICWELVCGRPPFGGEAGNFVEYSLLHHDAERPGLDPKFPVPAGLEDWVHRCMASNPDRRFQRAADALWALPSEGSSTSGREDGEGGGTRSNAAGEADDRGTSIHPRAPTLASTVVYASDEQTAVAETLPEPGRGSTEGAESSARTDTGEPEQFRPPVPETWHREWGEPVPAPLVDTGLGLFGLREPPFVDRRRERDSIWETLRRTVEERTSSAVLVAGEPGTGKSRLAEWMVTRAHEVGAARVVRAVHTPGDGPGEGLRGALERTLRVQKLDRREIFERLLRVLPRARADERWLERDARALTEYLRPTEEGDGEVDGPSFRFSSADQKRSLVVRILRRLASRRPVLLHVDDLQWGDDALDVLEYLPAGVDDSPAVSVVATVRSDVVAEDEWLRERLEDWSASPSVRRLELEPLERSDQRELLARLLPLEKNLADRLAGRTEGHPLFAVQLLGHWIESDVLEASSEGFRLVEERELALPADIHELWMNRIERLLVRVPEGHRADVREALELAAALGREVDEEEWVGLLAWIGLSVPEGLVDRLVEFGLADRSGARWSFIHGMLVESLGRHAAEAGRWRPHHRRCARFLEEEYPNRSAQTASRRAEHFIAAGELEWALEPLFEEFEWKRNGLADIRAGREILERRAELLEVIDAPADDPRRIENEIWRIRMRAFLDTPVEQTLEELEALRPRVERCDDEEKVAKYWVAVSWCHDQAGDLEASAVSAGRGFEYAERSGDETIAARALIRLGWTKCFRGDFEAAEEDFSEARRRGASAGDRTLERDARLDVAWVAASRGEPERARHEYEELLEEALELGDHGIALRCWNGLGELARDRGDGARARECFREYRAFVREFDRPADIAIASLNLAQVELMEGEIGAAGEALETAEAYLDRCGRTSQFIRLVRLVRLAFRAGGRDWEGYDESLGHYADGWPSSAEIVRDYPWLLEMAGDYAIEANEHSRAEQAWRIARDLWAELDDEDAVGRIEERLRAGAS